MRPGARSNVMPATAVTVPEPLDEVHARIGAAPSGPFLPGVPGASSVVTRYPRIDP